MRIIITVGLAVMLVLTALMGLAGPVSATSLCVEPGGTDGCFSTIQAAVDAATDGDTVNVVVGTYSENIIITKDLTLLGGFDDTTLASRTPRSSVIDGGGLGVVVKVTGGAVVTLDGFTVTGGNGTDNNGSGGGIFVDTASVTIADNLIEDNVASNNPALRGDGGGIYAITSTVVISGNTIQFNTAYSATTGSRAGAGGGIALGRATEATIINNEILSNTAAYLTASSTSAWGFGGGINCDGDQLLVEGNTIQNNLAISAGTFGVGGGVGVYGTLAVTITNNLIVENTTMITGTGNAYGGGVSAGGESGTGRRLVLTGNEISNNTTMVNGDGADIGVNGGVNLFGSSTPGDSVLLQNNDISGNIALRNAVPSGSTGGGYVDGAGVVIGDIASTLVISNNISNNIAVAGSDGTWTGDSAGGIHLSGNDVVVVTNNTISGNTSNAAGMTVWESVVTSTNNIFTNNSRGGLRADGENPPSTVRVINDTYYNNHEVGVETIGSGTTALVTNTIISGHQNGFLRSISGGSLLFSDYNLLSNTDNYEDATAGAHDITDQDPNFVDAANDDFHLAAGSPAIDTGTGLSSPRVDFEGDLRPQGGRIDIGVDEYLQDTWRDYLPIVLK